MTKTRKEALGVRAGLLVTLACLVLLPGPARAREPEDELSLRASLESVDTDSRGPRDTLAATARIRVEISSRRSASDVSFRVVRTGLEAAARVEVSGARWSRLDGLPAADLEMGRGSLAASRPSVAIVEVPLSGAGIHDLVVEISGTGPAGPVRREAFVRVPVGVPLSVITDDGEVASFPMEVRP